MRRPIFFVPGAGDPGHPEGSGHLAPYLTRELGDDYEVIAPAMPAPDDPGYRPWRDAVDRHLTSIEGAPILIGHSFGGSVLLKYLAEGTYAKPIPGLFLVSVPYWGPEFPDFALPDDFAQRLPLMPIFLYHSRDDPHVPFAHLARFGDRLPQATLRAIPGQNHSFTDGLPELITDIRSLE